jgi:enoyl-CoA hydratase/carnithine racemase
VLAHGLQTLKVATVQRVSVITLARPERFNAFNFEVQVESI